MRTAVVAAIAMIVAWSPFEAASAETEGGLAGILLKGCLSEPSQESAATLASKIGATPYSGARIQRELKRHEETTVVDDLTRPNEAQRTEVSVKDFAGWDLPGPSTGALEYREGTHRMTRVEVKTGQPITAWRVSKTRECRVAAPVANARKIYELYMTLSEASGVLISADRKWISLFAFDPDHYDIELQFQFDAPFAGLAPDVSQPGVSRLVLSDGGPPMDFQPGPSVSKVLLGKAAFLSGLDQTADMTFLNLTSERIVQRLSQSRSSRPEG